MSSIATSISTFLSQRGLVPSSTWLDSFVSSARTNTPIPPLQQTALFRLLASDITTSIQPSLSNSLSQNALDPKIKEQRLPGPLVVQVLDIEDVGHSSWSQVEKLEADARGETTRGRQVVRLVPADAGENGTVPPDANAAGSSTGPHKLLLQDAKGIKIYAFELVNVPGIGLNMSIGAKLLLRNVVIARGVILLDPAFVELLGGKVDSWDKSWRQGRKDVLRAKVGATDDD